MSLNITWQCKRYFSSSQVIARIIREVPDKPRYAYLTPDKIVKPLYMRECRGTPRREYQVNLIDGIRIRPTFNPYQAMTPERQHRLSIWKSRKWDDWDPYKCYVGFGGRRYQLPEDLISTKNELGLWQKPVLTNRYASDIKKQYIMHSLPWVWDPKFYTPSTHKAEREPIIGLRHYKQEDSEDSVKEAMRNMDKLKLQYLKEKKEKEQYKWWERIIEEMGGTRALEEYSRIRKTPRFT